MKQYLIVIVSLLMAVACTTRSEKLVEDHRKSEKTYHMLGATTVFEYVDKDNKIASLRKAVRDSVKLIRVSVIHSDTTMTPFLGDWVVAGYDDAEEGTRVEYVKDDTVTTIVDVRVFAMRNVVLKLP